MHKKIILPVLAAGVLGLGVLGVSRVEAFWGTSDGVFHTELIQKLSEKFDLDQNEVQSFFDDHRSQNQARSQQEMRTKQEVRLNQFVIEGKITEAQKQLILQKQTEEQTRRQQDMENWKDLNPEDRKTQMNQHHQEMEAWAEDNGIDLSLVGMLGPSEGHGMRGFRGGMRFDSGSSQDNQ